MRGASTNAGNVGSRLSDARPRVLMSRGNRSITQAAVTTCHTCMIGSRRAHVTRVVRGCHLAGGACPGLTRVIYSPRSAAPQAAQT